MTTPITDPFQFDELLTPAQRALRDQVREYMERVVRPAINDYWERGEIALALALGLRDLPIVGGTQRGYGCAELDCLSDGLVKYEYAGWTVRSARCSVCIPGWRLARLGCWVRRSRSSAGCRRCRVWNGWARSR